MTHSNCQTFCALLPFICKIATIAAMNIFANFLPEYMHFNAIDSANLILMLSIILLLGAMGGRLFQKLKIPQVVGYIVIGIIIGQSGLQLLRKEVITALDPVSQIALSLIGFLIGGELKLGVLKKYGKQFIGILLFEAIIPFIVVSIIVTVVSYLFTKDLNVSIALGLILGSISSATAPAATTDVLRENRTRGPLTTTVLGIVAMDDAVALILYAFSSSIASALLGKFCGLASIRSRELENNLIGTKLPLSDKSIQFMLIEASNVFAERIAGIKGKEDTLMMLEAQFLNLLSDSLSMLTL